MIHGCRPAQSHHISQTSLLWVRAGLDLEQAEHGQLAGVSHRDGEGDCRRRLFLLGHSLGCQCVVTDQEVLNPTGGEVVGSLYNCSLTVRWESWPGLQSSRASGQQHPGWCNKRKGWQWANHYHPYPIPLKTKTNADWSNMSKWSQEQRPGQLISWHHFSVQHAFTKGLIVLG